MLEDITEARIFSLQKLHATKMEMLGRVAGGMAHDFNNALTVIRGFIEVLQAGPDPDPTVMKYFSQIVASTERATSLTRQLYAFGQCSQIEICSFELNGVIKECTAMLRRVVREEVALQFELGHGLAKVDGDPNLIQQLVLLLTVHVRSYTARGGRILYRTCPALLGTSAVGLWIAGAIDATAHPLSPGVREAVLQQPDFAGEEDPGLSLVVKFVASFRGRLKQYHGDGMPPVFLIELPASNLPVAAGEAVALHEDLGPYGGSETVLVVEDDEPVMLAVASILRSKGYGVLTARDAAQALAHWEKDGDSIAMLFSDVVLPGVMSGCELGDLLQARRPGLPVLYTSGYAIDALPQSSRLVAGENYVGKPAIGGQLIQHIRRVLKSAG